MWNSFAFNYCVIEQIKAFELSFVHSEVIRQIHFKACFGCYLWLHRESHLKLRNVLFPRFLWKNCQWREFTWFQSGLECDWTFGHHFIAESTGSHDLYVDFNLLIFGRHKIRIYKSQNCQIDWVSFNGLHLEKNSWDSIQRTFDKSNFCWFFINGCQNLFCKRRSWLVIFMKELYKNEWIWKNFLICMNRKIYSNFSCCFRLWGNHSRVVNLERIWLQNWSYKNILWLLVNLGHCVVKI